MSQDYRPWIRRQSRAEHLAEFDRAMDWLESLLGRTTGGRFQTYRSRLSHAFRLLLEDRPDQILKQIPPTEFVEINFEANALIDVWQQFQTDDSSPLVEKLSKIVRGQAFTSSEGRKTEPRDILFELEFAAFLRSLGLGVRLGGLSDLTVDFQDVSALCECKRVQTPNALNANLQEAGSQLGTALGRWKEPHGCLGIVGLNVSKIIHLDASGVPRYPETQVEKAISKRALFGTTRNELPKAVSSSLKQRTFRSPGAVGWERPVCIRTNRSKAGRRSLPLSVRSSLQLVD